VIAEHLRRTRDAFVAATQGLNDAQMSFRLDDTGWSIADIVEHMALAERTMAVLVTEKMPQGAAPTPGRPTDADRFARLAARIPSRTDRRIPAPSSLVPKGTWPTVDAALAAFLEARASLIAAAETPGADVGARVVAHRLLGELDVEEWLYFAGLHTQRHAGQIVELRAAQGCAG
jgi:hypothetical protein